MSYAAERNAICGRFDTAWAGRTPVAWPNQSFTVPTATEWVRLTIVNAAVKRMTLGNPGANVHRHNGVITVQVFAPVDSGTHTARDLADQAAAIFRNQRFDGIRCDTASMVEVGAEDVWYQVNMSCAFRRDELL